MLPRLKSPFQRVVPAEASSLESCSILVTGASGLVGGNLLASLATISSELKLGLRLYGHSFSGGYPFAFPDDNEIQFLSGDLTNQAVLSEIPNVDYTIHCASYAQPAKFMNEPSSTLLLNTFVTHELMAKSQSGFLFISSSEVYSGLDGPPFVESQIGLTTPQHPRAMYIEGKRAGEAMVLAAEVPAAATAVRLSLAYGPGARRSDRRVLYDLIFRAMETGEVTLRGGGDSLRAYIYIDDAVYYLLSILIAGKRGIYNLGGIEPVSLAEVAQAISRVMELPLRYETDNTDAELSSGAPKQVALNLSNLFELVGKRDFVPLEIGLRETLRWLSTGPMESEEPTKP